MNKSNILWGVLLIILGVIFALNALELTNINIFFPGWWTLFIIIPSFIDILSSKLKISNILGLVIGILLLLASFNIISFKLIFKLTIPIILIIIGIYLILKSKTKGPKIENSQEK